MQTEDDFIGGGGAPVFKFGAIGAKVRGLVVKSQVKQQMDIDTGKPAVWDDGNPKMQLELTLQTTIRDPNIPNDDGKRRVFVKGGSLKDGLAAAMREAKWKVPPFPVSTGKYTGCEIGVAYTGNGKAIKKGYTPPKLYSVMFKPPRPDFKYPDQEESGDENAWQDEPAAPAAPRQGARPAPLPTPPAAAWDDDVPPAADGDFAGQF